VAFLLKWLLWPVRSLVWRLLRQGMRRIGL
jgi:hypothetical protein